jgi:fucose 4-O-acetylase-like acetyltransferase
MIGNAMPKKRIYAFDFMRAVAIIMIVAVHCIPEGPSEAAHVYATFMKALLLPCNAIFFLMSGMFNLNESALGNLRHYYYRKVQTILIPALVYMLINTVYDMARQPGPFRPDMLLETYGVNAFSA